MPPSAATPVVFPPPFANYPGVPFSNAPPRGAMWPQPYANYSVPPGIPGFNPGPYGPNSILGMRPPPSVPFGVNMGPGPFDWNTNADVRAPFMNPVGSPLVNVGSFSGNANVGTSTTFTNTTTSGDPRMNLDPFSGKTNDNQAPFLNSAQPRGPAVSNSNLSAPFANPTYPVPPHRVNSGPSNDSMAILVARSTEPPSSSYSPAGNNAVGSWDASKTRAAFPAAESQSSVNSGVARMPLLQPSFRGPNVAAPTQRMRPPMSSDGNRPEFFRGPSDHLGQRFIAPVTGDLDLRNLPTAINSTNPRKPNANMSTDLDELLKFPGSGQQGQKTRTAMGHPAGDRNERELPGNSNFAYGSHQAGDYGVRSEDSTRQTRGRDVTGGDGIQGMRSSAGDSTEMNRTGRLRANQSLGLATEQRGGQTRLDSLNTGAGTPQNVEKTIRTFVFNRTRDVCWRMEVGREICFLLVEIFSNVTNIQNL